MQLNSNLVVLSACLSGRVGAFGGQKYLTTDDLTGLTRALLYAGAANVMGTLWTVDDKSTGVMMEHFYEKYRDEKRPLLFFDEGCANKCIK
ncbi:MAG: CHAT domain-containing protein [Ignavibacteriales bacterium]|nr:CHAT domain-containing protein [Ignavibacteriales bacterium]